MKRLLILLLLLVAVQPIHAQTTLWLEAPSSIQAGDALTVTVHAAVKAKMTLALYNGIARLATTLTADATTGVAVWEIPAGVLTSAGESVITAHVTTTATRQTIRVLPAGIDQLDFLTTVNNLTAYGKVRTQLVALVGDSYGNPLSLYGLKIEARYPNSESRQVTLPTKNGLAWTWLSSAGSPGRLRLSLTAASLSRSLELTQMPSAPANVNLILTPTCLLDDGRDVLTLEAHVTDDHDNPVANSTQVEFTWNQGKGSAQIFNGVASLRVPAPHTDGRFTFIATSGDVSSLPAQLQVQQEACP